MLSTRLGILICLVHLTRCRRPLVRRQAEEWDRALFNFMPSLQKERDYQDVTLDVLSLLDEEEVRTARESFSSSSSSSTSRRQKSNPDVINFPSDPPIVALRSPLDSTATLTPLSEVDCDAAKLPLKNKPKVRKWVSKWSQHCKQPRGAFRYPSDCHAYIDCWDGRGTKRHCYPRTLVFDERTGRCDWPNKVRCVIGNKHRQKKMIDLDQPYCSNYTAMGYKCVNFWECSSSQEIIDDVQGYYGEGVIDARMVPPKKTSPLAKGSFDPFSKQCPGQFETCCKGHCRVPSKSKEKQTQRRRGKQLKLDESKSSALCPSDYVGNRPIPGICDKFAECFKGRAIVKRCPPGLHFCIHSLMCDWPRKIVCDQLDLLTRAETLDTQSDEPKPRIDEGSSPPKRRKGSIARKTSSIPAPPSGQLARLRHGRTPAEGYLQIFHDGKWGYACDKSGWTKEEANVVCKQLGFRRGVRKTTQGLVHGRVDESQKITEHIECAGSEATVESCRISYSQFSQSACKVGEDIVSISCIPDSWATCNKNEIPWGSRCYSFFPNSSSFHSAQDHCKSLGRTLVEIESQEENDMLSELLFQNSKVTDVMNEVWTGGVGSNVARKNVWFWHSDTDKPMEFRNFWKGWSGGERSAAEIKDNFAFGIKMSRKYPIRKGQRKKDQLTDYYFWNLDSFDTKLSYICERPMNNIGCIEGNGETYRGMAERTYSGAFCKPWQSPEIGFWFDEEQIQKLGPLANNKYCRNPDENPTPWCLIKDGEYEECDILPCEKESQANMENNPRIFQESSCGSDQFECQPGECIFSGYVCDGEHDCSNKKDENPHASCDNYQDSFESVSNVKLNVESVERWTNRNIEACLRACILSKDFVCKGVNYKSNEKTCILLESNVGLSGSLEENFEWTYFERRETQVVCDENTMCSSGKCLNETQFCDGKFDCSDKKDENNCKATPNVNVRLVGGDSEHEGRIELKAFDYGWGGICDDGFGILEANVICKEAGFPLGAKEAILHSKFGSGDEILLDELDCKGNENSLLDCKFNPWKEHDCSAKEYAGVVCRQRQESCGEEEWKCQSGECISLEFLCDSTSDCSDGSDESANQCQKDVEVRLAGGNNVTSGRVEVQYKGVWGTICDDNFDAEEGSVICKMLGHPGGVKVHPEAVWGEGKGPIWINNILCNGTETSLEECPSPAWGPTYQCKHSEDVGIECLPDAFSRIDSSNAAVNSGSQQNRQCGVAEVEFKPSLPIAKVAGGQTAVHGSQPWTASIRVRGNLRSFHWCGAVLITDRHILTAAHCVEDYPKDVYAIRVGDWDQDVEDIGEQEFSIQAVNFHPEFNIGAYLNNDIAVVTIKLNNGRGVQFSDKVVPACLPEPSATYNPGMECSISGWGSLGQNSGGYSRRLQSSRVPILPTTECMKKHVYGPDKLTGGMFCAGFLEGGVDSCQGDSGGPMVCQRRDKNTLLGIISWGYGCGRPNKPGVYTRVANYVDWIKGILE